MPSQAWMSVRLDSRCPADSLPPIMGPGAMDSRSGLRAVRSARGSRSAQEIADETARLGYPLSRSQIANLESGRKRSLDIAELLIIAAALEVPPVTLLYPDLPNGEVEVLPGQFVSSTVALLRFTGERDSKPTSDLGRLAKLSREHFDKKIRHAA